MANTVCVIVPLIGCLISGYPRLSSRWFAGVTFGKCLCFQTVAICLAYGLVSGVVSGVQILDINPVTVSSIASQVVLICALNQSTQLPIYSVRWNKDDGHHVITKHLHGLVEEGGLFTDRVHLVQPASLLLLTPRMNDSGVYTCTVLVPSDPHPTDRKSVQLDVKDVSPAGTTECGTLPFTLGAISVGICMLLGIFYFAMLVIWRRRWRQKTVVRVEDGGNTTDKHEFTTVKSDDEGIIMERLH